MATTTLNPAAHAQTAPSGIDISRRSPWRSDLLALLILLVAALGSLAAAYARAPQVAIGVVGQGDGRYLQYKPHLQNFHEPETLAGAETPSYRWTQAESTIMLPGTGRGWWQTTLALGSPVPADQPKQALISAGGRAIPVQLGAQTRRYHLFTPSDGDMRIAITSPAATYGSDPRPLGVVFDGLALEPIAVVAFPPTPLLLYSLIALALMFLTLRVIGLRPWLALSMPLIGLALLAWGVTVGRTALGLYGVRLVGLTVVGLLLTLATKWIAPRLFRLGGVEVGGGALTALLLVVYVGYLVRAAGLLWPYFLAIDIEWHMNKTRMVLDGRINELWDANSPFHQSVMPTDEWGEDKPLIPYSPFYHIFSVIWVIFPWALETSANIWSAVIDALRPVLIFFIVRRLGFNDRAGVIGGLAYSIIPATLLMHAWGNTPTTNGMWWSLLAVALLVGTWDRLRASRTAWIALTLVLTATLLFYAVTAVFTTLLVLGVAAWLIVGGRKRDAWQIIASMSAAIVLSLAIFYWQFVPGIVERTLPKLAGSVTSSINATGAQPDVLPSTPGEIVTKTAFLFDIYGFYLPLGLGLAGWWIGLRSKGVRSLFGGVMSVWLLIAIVFFFVGLRVVMVDKQWFWLMPWMGIGTGIAVDRIMQARRLGWWAVPLLAIGALYLSSDAIYLWVHRLHNYRGDLAFTSWLQVLRSIL